MKLRHVFSTPDLASARRAVGLLQGEGLAGDDIALVARSDIELDSIPDRLKEADTDFVPAAIRGLGLGGATGALAGLAAMVFTPLGITVAGVAALAAMGALVGGWSSALMGADLPDPVRQQFDDEIAAGRVLLLVDAEPETHARLEPLLARAGAGRLEYELPKAMS